MIDTQPSGPRIFGSPQIFLLYRHPETFVRLARKHGDVVRFKVGPRDVYLVSHPDMIDTIFKEHYAHFEKDWGPGRGHSALRSGLVTSEGALHRTQRTAMSKIFSRGAIDAQRPAIAEVVEAWSASQVDGAQIDIIREMAVLAATVSARIFYGYALDPAAMVTAIDKVFLPFRKFMFPYANRLRVRRDISSGIERLVTELRDRHRRAPLTGILAPLFESADHGEPYGDDQLSTFLVSSTSAMRLAMSWAWFALSQNPEAKQRLQQESQKGEESSYAEAVLLEAMRLYPPQWMIGRRALGPFAVGGVDIPARALVLMSPYIVHRDERFFPDAERFLPERWLGPQSDDVRRAYFPFGRGPRRCIGEHFAMTVATTVLSQVSRRWTIDCSGSNPSFQAALELKPRSMRGRLVAVNPSASAPSPVSSLTADVR